MKRRIIWLWFLTFAIEITGLRTQAFAAQDGQKLNPNDLIHVKVFKEDDLETKVRIGKDGTISFPLIGVVKLSGKTANEAASTIRELLEKDYLFNPQVSVTILESAPRRFTVLGQVQRPGTYTLPEAQSLDLLQAIGMAGGYTRIANPRKVTIKRNLNGKEVVLHADAKEMARNAAVKPVEVTENDIITVNESMF